MSPKINFDNDLIKLISSLADESNLEAYLVGGYVRDKILGKDVKDIDVMVVGDAIQFAHKVSRHLNGARVVKYENFGTAMIPLSDGKLEFVTAREEKYLPESRKPIIKKSTLEADLSRRDFTINAIAISINSKNFGEMYDPFNGFEDIQNKIIRTPLDPIKTFEDDPLRILRAIRFASTLGFVIEENTFNAISIMKDRLAIISQERITDEFLKILTSPKPSVGLSMLQNTSVASKIFPELSEMSGVDQREDYHHKDVLQHTFKVVDSIAEASDNVWLRFTGLVHDIAKPKTKAFKEGVGWTFYGHEEVGARMMKNIFRRMRLPMDRLPYVEKLIRLHLRPMALVSDQVTDSAVRRLLFDAGELIDDLMLLCKADITSQNPQKVTKYLNNYDIVIQKMKEVEEKDRLRNWQPPVKGDEIMRVCGLNPGKTVGILKKEIENAILNGIIPNEHDAALEYLLSIKDKIIADSNKYVE